MYIYTDFIYIYIYIQIYVYVYSFLSPYIEYNTRKYIRHRPLIYNINYLALPGGGGNGSRMDEQIVDPFIHRTLPPVPFAAQVQVLQK